MSAALPGLAERVFAQFLQLERQARAAKNIDSMAYVLANDAQGLFGYRHAALLIAGKVRALTGVSVVEPNAPFVAFVEHAASQLLAQERSTQAQVIPAQSLDAQEHARTSRNALGAHRRSHQAP